MIISRDELLSPGEPTGRFVVNISQEERERRRQRALAQHAKVHPDDPSRRLFGGPQPGSGPKRQKRATEVAAERIARQGNLMADAVIGAMRDTSPSIRLQGVRLGMEIEHREAELRLKEDRSLDEMSNAELVQMIVDAAIQARRSGALPIDDGNTVEGTATLMEDAS